MRMISRAAVGVLLAAGAVSLLHGDGDNDPVATLIRQLGHADYARREQASRELVTAGERALPALLQAESGHSDLETRQRARRAVRAILEARRQSLALGLELAVVDAGQFSMGSPAKEEGRRPDEAEHQVRITRPFLLGAHAVTQQEFQQVMKFNPSWFQPKGGGKAKVADDDTRRFPVDSVTWFDAIEFCNRLSKLDGYEPYYQLADVKRTGESIQAARVTVLGGNGYRLPTEAEWEYACRAGSTTRFHFGDQTARGLINCKPLVVSIGYGSAPKWPEVGSTAKVGSHPASGLGLYEMHGNIGQWCWDWYDKDYYDRSPKDDPTGPETGNHRVLRGGSWMVTETSCRSASRFFHIPEERKDYAGFRVARTPGPPRK